MRNEIKQRLIALSMTMLLGMGAWGCGSDTAGGDTPTPDPTGTPVTISGTVSTVSASLSALPRQSMKKLSASVSADVTPVTGYGVTVTKKNSDGTTELVSGATATTDANGNFSVTVDAVTSTAAGQANDYYIVSATDGTNILNSIVAPLADSTFPVSPGTTFAEAILNNGVGGISGTPSPDQINSMNALYDKVLTDLPQGVMEYPPNTNSAEGTALVLATANGVSAAGGDAATIFQGVVFESNFYSILTDVTSDATDSAQYVKKAILYGCDQPSQQPLSDLDANVVGQALQGGVTSTPTEIVAAMNAASNNPDIAVDTAVSGFVTLLTNIENISPTTGLETSDMIALNVKRNLTAATFTASTALDADQAVAFIESLNFGTGPQAEACGGNLDITDILAELTQASELASPAIKQVQIFADSGFNCNEGDNLGHFRAEVQVYLPFGSSTTVTGVNIVGTNGINQQQLTGQNGTYTFNTDGVCVTHGTEVTYTATVTLSDTTTLETQVTRNHPLIDEAVTTVNGLPTSNDANNPDVFGVNRPLYTWLTPEAALAGITNAPADSVVKYTYEFSHVQKSNPSGPLNQQLCGFVSSGALYSVNSFLPTVDCDPTACSAALGGTPAASDIICRMNIQVFLVDQYDNYLGQAAGNFPVFTVQ